MHFVSPGVPLDAPALSPSTLPFLFFPFNPSRGPGECCKLPSGSGQSPATKRILVDLEVIIKRFRGQLSCIFNRQNLKVLL